MQLRYRRQGTAAGVSVVALALVLGACSSSSSSSSSGGSSPASGSSSGGGSGKGRTDLAAGAVNFAGPITMSYNLPGISRLKLDPKVIADIFEGKIKTWNDPAIKADNPGVNLPSTAVTLAVRSDSSGTTQNFTLFLADAAGSAWTLGSDSAIKWPSSARAGSGNGGVAQIIKSTPGAIGYVDYTDAKASSLSMASVKN